MLEREERLQRVNIRQQEFRAKKQQHRSMEMAKVLVEMVADKAVEDAKINLMLRDAEDLGPAQRNRLEQKLMEQRMNEARAA